MGVLTILSFFDREPVLARVCVVQALRAGPLVLERREAVLARLAAVVDEGRSEGARGDGLTAVTAEGVVGAAFAIVYSRLSRGDGEPLTGLLGELMAMIVLPYLGPAVARRERARPAPAAPAAVPMTRAAAPSSARDPLADVNLRLTHRTARVLEGHRGAERPRLGSQQPRGRDVRRCQRPGADLEASASSGAPRAAWSTQGRGTPRASRTRGRSPRRASRSPRASGCTAPPTSGGPRDATGALIHLVEGTGAPRACGARTEPAPPQRLHNTNQGEQGETHRAHREGRCPRRRSVASRRSVLCSTPKGVVRPRAVWLPRLSLAPLCSAGALCRRRPSRTSQAHLLRKVQRAGGRTRLASLWKALETCSCRVSSEESFVPLDGGQARSFGHCSRRRPRLGLRTTRVLR